MSYKQGDIIEAYFPFADKQGSKKRPCLVISNDKLSGTFYSEILVVPISTKNQEDGFSLPFDNARLSVPLLLKKSFIRYYKIEAVTVNDIERKISRVNADYLKEIVSQITSLFEVE